MTSAERIRILRERDGMSQNDLAAKLELSRSSISMYEAGERVPSTYVYQAMADLFNVDLDYIMGRSDKTTVLPEWLDYENKALGNTIYINRTLSAMRQLNEEGQKIVANQAELVKASGKYDRAKSERIYKEAAYGGDLDSDTADERLAIVDKRRKILEEKDKKQK